MFKRNKKLMSKLLVLSVCTSLLSTTIVFAEVNKTVEAWNNEDVNASVTAEADFTFDASTGTITRYGGEDATVVIPSIIKGVSVTSIGGDAFKDCSSLVNVTIPSGVTSIGSCAFFECSNLASITMPESVTSIGYRAFSGCISLTSITIPNNIKVISEGLLSRCSNLKEVIMPSGATTIKDGAFYNCSSLSSITIPEGVTTIEENSFLGCKSLSSIIIPNGVTTIEDSTFMNCSGLKDIIIPNSVTNIGYRAFYGCSGLMTVTIPNSVTTIGQGAFTECSGLMMITIPSSVVNIEDYAFYKCGLRSVTILDGVKSIGKSVFSNCINLRTVDIPNSISTIGISAFSKCDIATFYVKSEAIKNLLLNNSSGVVESEINFKSESDFEFDKETGTITKYNGTETDLEIPNEIDGVKVKNIGHDAFAYCTNLKNVIIANGITGIRANAFEGCINLTNIEMPDSLASIGAYAFLECNSLTSIKIPDGVSYLGRNTFYGCTSLVSITIPKSVIAIEYSAFFRCDNAIFYVPNEAIRQLIFDSEIPKSKYDIKVKVGNRAINELDFKFDGSTGKIIGHNVVRDKIVIPNEIAEIKVTGIGDSAFSDCDIKSVEIPDSVTNIEREAFCNCYGLQSITIPESVISIGAGAFLYNLNLKDITMPNNLTSIEPSTFFCSGLTNIKLPNNLKSIGKQAFYGCSYLKELTMPDGLKSIGESAFGECNGLERVVIPSSVTSIGESAFEPIRETIFYVENEKTKSLLRNIGIRENKIILNSQSQIKVAKLSLSSNSLNCILGDQKTLTATLSPSDASDQTVTWSSSDNTVATVGINGNIKVVGVGSATITCTTNDGSGISATCNITVSGQNDTGGTTPTNVKATGITINGNSSISTKGGTVTLTTSIIPSNATNKTVTWISSDTNIATVDNNGVVTAKSNGNVTITATANDGSGANQAKTIRISGQSATGGTSGMTPTEVKVTGITINGSNIISTKGDTITLTPNILPSTASNKTVTWTSSNPSVATVSDQGVVTAISNGSAIITATAADGSKIAGTKVITVTGQTTTTNNSSDSVLQSISIYGTEEVGHTLKAKVKYNGTKPELQYQWQRASKKDGDYTDISGADEEEYKLKSSDRNKYIKVIVSSTINGTTYNVEDITSKIDRDTSDDDDEDNDSSNSSSSSSSNTYNNNNDVGILRLPSTTNKSPNSVGYNASTTNSSSPANGVFTNPAGHPISGWVSSSDKWYYLDNNGHAQVGWINDNGKWYYFNTSGDSNRAAMKTGWVQDNGKWYYLDQSGAMVSNTTIDGYRLGGDGAMI